MLRGVDLVLPARALVRVEGANGTGKSTLLRLLARIDAPSEGRVTGRPRTAYVPERFPAALPFTAAGYLVHLGRVHGLSAPEAAARADRWLTRFGAAAHARTSLAELSKGTSQKVAVAQALLAEPELLVLDEAWTGLDTEARDVLDRAVAERVAAGATVVYVDHDPRRLAGAVDAAYRVEGLGLTAAPLAPAESRVRIEATAPPGTPLPAGLPGSPACTPTDDGTVRLTVPAAHSDALLAALLSARPRWHIGRVEPVRGAGPGLEPESVPHRSPTPDGDPVP
ncbi:ATP-binding cassette domain-containing protein [Streptomyces sp. NBC_00441]|uniref:ATP-binding cassette domain-containing protein n=1 Tax=Streptomyces sp. NBC_00441 TaxID=2975742 RepID=UPI002E2856A6|nr:ATP-binding cassette domain-containing protein [Streptomyces sp. NBC_00441]